MNTYTVYLNTGMRAVIHGETLEHAMKLFRRSMACISYYRHGRDDSLYFDVKRHQWMQIPLEEPEVG